MHFVGEGEVYIWCAELEETALPTVRVISSLAGGKSNAPLNCQMRILLPHLLFSNLEYSCTRELHILLLDTVRALQHQPDLCFYLSWCHFCFWYSAAGIQVVHFLQHSSWYCVVAVPYVAPPDEFTRSGAVYEVTFSRGLIFTSAVSELWINLSHICFK